MEPNTLYIFNPENDAALANGNENFVAPSLARTFAFDMRHFPLWYADPQSIVLANEPDQNWIDQQRLLFPQLKQIEILCSLNHQPLKDVEPWGWSALIGKQLSALGIDHSFLPNPSQMKAIREASHRKTAIDALVSLRMNNDLAPILPHPAQQLNHNEIEEFACKHNKTVFKAPWSGSGQGLFWIEGNLSKNALNWCHNVVKKQGCIIGERVYDKILDFAMEFSCTMGEVYFAGYSLFEADHQGIYKNNRLLSDQAIHEVISHYIDPGILTMVREKLQLFIKDNIASFYSGYLGVDMMVYAHKQAFMLHPCVEINLRMTMGMAARKFYDNFVKSHLKGMFYVDYFQISKKLMEDHLDRTDSLPLKIENGKITRGYISLSPITPQTRYRIRVELGDK